MISYNMTLTKEEQAILNGEKGETMRKALESVVWYGETFGATHLAPVTHGAHLVTSFGIPMLRPVFSLMNELIEAGLTTPEPFTADPRPMDFENVPVNLLEKLVFKKVMYGMQDEYEQMLAQVGMKSPKGFTCTCYMDEVGNIPEEGAVLSWAESSAVVYANSVLGARCNRNSGVLELLGSVVGRAPVFGLLTDEGRKADWVIEVDTQEVPNAQVLGSAIGMKVMEQVPYIKGLDRLLGSKLTPDVKDFFKDMGAASASNGAVGLYHVDGLTPEAVRQGESLVKEGAPVYRIDEAELRRVKDSYPMMWKKPDAKPQVAFIGCPHLSKKQIYGWMGKIAKALKQEGRKEVRVTTVMTAAPEVVETFLLDKAAAASLKGMGIRLSSICPLMYMNNPLCRKKAVLTNSNKLRTYTTARFVEDDLLAQILAKGAL